MNTRQGFLAHEAGCCGIYAIAEATGMPFALVFEFAKAALHKRASWKGSTTDSERTAILERLGADYTEAPTAKGLTLLEAAYPGVLDPSFNYVFSITGHVVCLKGYRLIDQCSKTHPIRFKYRNYTVLHAYAVRPMEAAPADDDLLG